jgi:hypothetical protein
MRFYVFCSVLGALWFAVKWVWQNLLQAEYPDFIGVLKGFVANF